MSQVNQEIIIVQDEVQSMNCEGPNTNRNKEEEQAVEQGLAVESADDQEHDSGEQHAPITAHDQEGGNGEQHVVQPAANKEQPMDNGEPLSEAEYLRNIDNITINIIDECKGFQNPVAILKKAQEHILVDPSTELKGKTNFIIIDRDHVFQDALGEVVTLLLRYSLFGLRHCVLEFPDELMFLWENKIVNTATNMFSFIRRYNQA